MGIVVAVRESGEKPRDNRSFVDYEEIESLIRAIESLARVNETVTKLTGFEARYRTSGDLETQRFPLKPKRRCGIPDEWNLRKDFCAFTLDELERFKGIILEAKTRLDEIR